MKKLSLFTFLILFVCSNLFTVESIEKKNKKMNDYLNDGWKLLGKVHVDEKGKVRTFTLKKGNNIVLCQVSFYILAADINEDYEGRTLCYEP